MINQIKKNESSSRRGLRQGTVLIAALVCMVVAVTIVMGMIQTSVRHRRQLNQELQMQQTLWLLDAGISQAHRQLREQPDYDGETIEIAELSKYENASVKIVATEEASDQSISVRVTASIGDPDDDTKLTRRTREFVVNKE